MDFSLSEQEEQFRRVLREFAARELAQRAARIDADASFPTDLLPKLGELGVFGLLLPASFGGTDAGMLSFLIAAEELSAGCASTGSTVVGSVVLSFIVAAFGGDGLKDKVLRRMARGEAMGATGITEPSAGEDISGIQTSAWAEGNDYRVNGNKVFISNAGLAEYYAVMVRSEPAPGLAGLSMLAIEKGTPGFSIGKLESKLGLRGHPVGELIFEDCLVPTENLLAAPGAGMQVQMACLGPGLLGCGSSSVGIARAAFDKAVGYAKERRTFGQPIGTHQSIQTKIFDMATDIEAARLLLQRAAHQFDRRQLEPVEAFRAKLFATEMAVKVTYEALQIHGGYGYSTEFPLERHFRDARANTLHAQTPELARTLGGAMILGFGPPPPLGH